MGATPRERWDAVHTALVILLASLPAEADRDAMRPAARRVQALAAGAVRPHDTSEPWAHVNPRHA